MIPLLGMAQLLAVEFANLFQYSFELAVIA